MSAIYRVTRRDFLRDLGVGAGALVLGCSLTPSASAEETGHSGGLPCPDVPFVEMKPNGDVVIITHRSEMGQGARASLAAVLADELEADWSRVTLRQADGDATRYGVPFPLAVPPDAKLPRPYDTVDRAKPYIVAPASAQFTDGSRSMTFYYMPMRLFGACVRLVLIRAAAKEFGAPASECYAEQHHVIHRPTGRSLDYKLLMARAKNEPMPKHEEILEVLKKKPEEFRFIGKKIPLVDAPDMVTGKTKYCADIHLPGMLVAMIERCPVANGDVKDGYDDSEARAVPGVVDVITVRIPGTLGLGGVGNGFAPHAGVAVLATNTWAAWQGRRKLKDKVEWVYPSPLARSNKAYDSETYRRSLEAEALEPAKPVQVVRSRNGDDVDAAIAGGKPVEATYYVPLLAQTPMEPPVAIALLENDRLEVWAPTQNPDATQQIAGQVAFGKPVEKWGSFREEMQQKVKVHVTLLGGGFGRKSKPDYIAEAAFLAAKRPGVPIKVQWTRSDDVKFSYFNACAAQHLKAGLGADGKPAGLLWRSVFPSIFATLSTPPREDFTPEVNAANAKNRTQGTYPYGSPIERAQGLEDMPFDIPSIRIENCAADNHIRIGWMRAVANVYHAFAICSFADEMARAAGKDSRDYLLELIGKGRVLKLGEEGVPAFSNNGSSVDQIQLPGASGAPIPVVAGYPPDTRRLRRVVEEVARISNWNAKGDLPKGHGLGIAAHRSFLTYVALVLHVSLDEEKQLTIHEAYAAVDCGLVVNPDRVRAQIEGGINYGLSMALLGEITVKDGAVVENNFDDYPVLRIDKAPKKFVMSFVTPDPDDSRDLRDQGVAPTGVGEPPTPVVAPALANAIVAAGGPRIREMPFRRHIRV